MRTTKTGWIFGAWLTLAGCSAPIAADLGEHGANRVVVALEQAGIAAEKSPDPAVEGRYVVSVPRDDAAAALTVLTQENLPPPEAPGVLAALGENSIVPSRSAEHAKLVTGIAGELERSLGDVSGVVAARVHLAVPADDPLTTSDNPTEPSASVLVRHRGAAPPITADDVQRLVAGAVPGLEPDRVTVVSTPAPPLARLPERELAQIGPITTTRASLPWARAIGASVVVALLVLAAAVVALWARVRRLQNEALSGAEEARDAP